MNLFIPVISFFLFLSFSSFAFNSPHSLANNPIWLKLGHYKSHIKPDSYITNNSFFLAKDGKNNPLSEIKATLHAFDTDASMQCQFPARYQWLTEQGVSFKQGTVECPDLAKWRDSQKIHSVSLVFASGYMSNPASLYGHLLLKLNRSTKTKNQLLDYSINYGAHVPENENGLIYITKGLFGGYKAGFSDQLFYRHQHNYGEIELRDLWEYTLDLTPRDVTFIANHLWELLGTDFDYYFADENCAFHLAQIIELVIGDQLTKSSTPWVIPATIFSRLERAQYNGKKAVKEIKFTPSRNTVFNKHIDGLTTKEIAFVKSIYLSPKVLSSNDFLNLTIHSQKAIIGTLFELVQLKQVQKQTPTLTNKLKKALIKARLKLPIGENKHNYQYSKQPPHKAQKASNTSFTAAHSAANNYFKVGFRLSYFDSLASDIARIPFSNLEMLDTEVTLNNNNFYLNKVHLLDLESFNPNSLDWANETMWSWKINLGFERQESLCRSCKSTFAVGGVGKSWQFNEQTLTYVLINGAIGDLPLNSHFYDSSVEAGIITGSNSGLKLRASFEQSYLHNKLPGIANLEVSLPINQDLDVRFAIEYANESVWQLKLNYYWQ